jgi:hypothetical protein
VPRYKNKLEKGMGCLLKDAGIPFLYEPDRIAYNKVHHYVPDFKLDGFYIETKGRFLPADRTKHRLLKEQHPDLDIRFVFQQPNHTLNPKSKTTYAQWCDKHGFLWSGTKLPKSWFS